MTYEELDPCAVQPGLLMIPSAGPTPKITRPLPCCARSYDDHPQADSTMLGTCRTHLGIEVALHWDGRGYRCCLCATEAFHREGE